MPRRDVTPTAAPAAGLSNIRIVLVRPRGAANVGAAARAMKNMGVGALTLVAPALRRLSVAEAMAVHARDLVRAAPVVTGIAEAVADCRLVVGTTCRGGPYRAAVEEPLALAPALLAHAARGPVAILFGPEDHGLTNEDLLHCQRLLMIDTSTAYTSLNLAQAVLLVCYELRRAATANAAGGSKRARRGSTRRLQPDPAPAAMLERMYDHLQSALLSIGFLNRQNPDHIMFAVRQLFGRTTLADHEVRILLGLARQIAWYARTNGDGRPSKSDNGVAGGRLPVAGSELASDDEGAPGIETAAIEDQHVADGAHRPLATGHRPRRSPSAGNRSRRMSHG